MGDTRKLAATLLPGLILLTSCGQAGTKADSHFECAAVISAVTYMMAEEKLPLDPAFRSEALVPMMSHLNAYAIPQGLSEKDAFAALNARRDELRESAEPDQAMKRARACVESAP